MRRQNVYPFSSRGVRSMCCFWFKVLGLQGDAKTRLKDWKGAAAAFEKSLSLSDSPTLGQYEGMAAALTSDKQYSTAVEKLQSYESKVSLLKTQLPRLLLTNSMEAILLKFLHDHHTQNFGCWQNKCAPSHIEILVPFCFDVVAFTPSPCI